MSACTACKAVNLNDLKPLGSGYRFVTTLCFMVSFVCLFGVGDPEISWVVPTIRTLGIAFGSIYLFRLVYDIRRSVIGHEVWCYLDSDRQLHMHLRQTGSKFVDGYLIWKAKSCGKEVMGESEPHISGCVFRLPVGGWFRRPAIFKPLLDQLRPDYQFLETESSWKLTRGCRANKVLVTIRDTEKATSVLLLADAIQTVNQNHNVRRSLEQKERFAKSIIQAVTMMDKSKQTLGRSKHAQLLRGFLQKELDAHSHIWERDRWAKEIAREEQQMAEVIKQGEQEALNTTD